MAIQIYVFLFAISILNGIVRPDDPVDWHIDITNFMLFELVRDRNELEAICEKHDINREHVEDSTVNALRKKISGL